MTRQETRTINRANIYLRRAAEARRQRRWAKADALQKNAERLLARVAQVDLAQRQREAHP